MATKVSQMPAATEIKDGDVLMIIQDGQNKKISADEFQAKGQTAKNSEKLNGFSDTDFVKKTENAKDTNYVNGTPSADMATKAYVDTKAASLVDWKWCCPQLWFDDRYLPNNDSEHFRFCDGSWLSITEYHDLFEVIGHRYSEYEDDSRFQIPNMMGRFPLGAYTYGNTPLQTYNLPNGLYQGECFTSNGQYIFPDKVGMRGGDPTTTQEDTSQMAKHLHELTDTLYHRDSDPTGSAGSSLRAFKTIEWGARNTQNEGANMSSMASYPPNYSMGDYGGNSGNNGMLSMPPYLTFAWVMQVKK